MWCGLLCHALSPLHLPLWLLTRYFWGFICVYIFADFVACSALLTCWVKDAHLLTTQHPCTMTATCCSSRSAACWSVPSGSSSISLENCTTFTARAMANWQWAICLSWEWSVMRIVYHKGGLSWEWSVLRIVYHKSGLSWEWSVLMIVYHKDGLSWEWSVLRIVHRKQPPKRHLPFVSRARTESGSDISFSCCRFRMLLGFGIFTLKHINLQIIES